MAESSGEKSFDATPHRRQECASRAKSSFSQDLASAAMLMLARLLLMMLGGAVLEYCVKLLRHNLADVGDLQASQENLVHESIRLGYTLAAVLLPIMGLMMLGGVLSSVLQIGLLWLPERLAPISAELVPPLA